METTALITTSWDDGHPNDSRLASLLERHNFKGTFYVPLRNREGRPVMAAYDLCQVSKQHEIGSHTKDHCYLTTVSDAEAWQQISEGKTRLEEILGTEVRGFCYPGGKFKAIHVHQVRMAGFDFARTTENFHSSAGADPMRLPTTIQIYPHSGSVIVRNFLRFGKWRKRYSLSLRALLASSLDRRLLTLAKYIVLHGGLLHLWGHSWELDAFDGWSALEDFFRFAADYFPRENRLTNAETHDLIAASKLVISPKDDSTHRIDPL